MHGVCQLRMREAGSNQSRNACVDEDLFGRLPFRALFEEALDIIMITILNHDSRYSEYSFLALVVVALLFIICVFVRLKSFLECKPDSNLRWTFQER